MPKRTFTLVDTLFEEYYANFLGMKWNVGLDRKLKDHPRIILIEDEYVIDEELQIFSNIKGTSLFTYSKQ